MKLKCSESIDLLKFILPLTVVTIHVAPAWGLSAICWFRVRYLY